MVLPEVYLLEIRKLQVYTMRKRGDIGWQKESMKSGLKLKI